MYATYRKMTCLKIMLKMVDHITFVINKELWQYQIYFWLKSQIQSSRINKVPFPFRETKIWTNHSTVCRRLTSTVELTDFQNLPTSKHCSWSMLSSCPLCWSLHINTHSICFWNSVLSLSASCWCKSRLRFFICQWRPFILIQDRTIFKKSTWWRQCNIM